LDFLAIRLSFSDIGYTLYPLKLVVAMSLARAGYMAGYILVFFCLIGLASGVDPVLDDVNQEIRIPGGVTLTREDTYVCTTVRLPDQPMKLVGVVPQASMDVVHHILLFGCNTPHEMPEEGKPQPAWECGMTCADGGSQILYGWGR